MVKFEPESQEKTGGGEKGRGKKKREGLVKQTLPPVLAADADSPWVRLEWICCNDWNWEEWDLAQAGLPKQEKPTGNKSRDAVLTS